MHFTKQLTNAVVSKVFSIKNLSIKTLTWLGFTLVALPLVIVLLVSANQIAQISKQSADAIFDVAALINTNKELSSTLKKMERYASQYVVLKDNELMASYLQQEQQILTIISVSLSHHMDDKLTTLTENFHQTTNQIHNLLLPIKTLPLEGLPLNKLSLEPLQKQFKQLALINEAINLRSNALINLEASDIKESAEKVSTMMLNFLLIIPITIMVAIFFIMLITKPLKALTQKIHRLEQGDFQQKITLSGSTEIREIADALDIMRTRLHALELQKSSFIRHISHELKTPLAAIREGTELLYDNTVGQLNTEQQEICQIIKMSVSRLQRLIEDLLNFNIILDSTSLQDSEKHLLSGIIEEVLTTRKLDIKRKKIMVNQEYRAIALHCNAQQLSVILDNILSNAIKFSPEYGIINISAKLNNKQVLLCITDNGPGIRESEQDKVFDAFYQGKAPEDNRIKGSGLGLTIVKELLMRLNGYIRIESGTKIPSYTSVHISLPRAYNAEEEN